MGGKNPKNYTDAELENVIGNILDMKPTPGAAAPGAAAPIKDNKILSEFKDYQIIATTENAQYQIIKDNGITVVANTFNDTFQNEHAFDTWAKEVKGLFKYV